MKNLVTVLLVSVISMTVSVNKANAQYNSFIKKEYRGDFNNNIEALKDSILFGKNAQKFLLVPVKEFDRLLKERITIYNNAVPHFDQIDDDAVDKVCDMLKIAKPDPKKLVPMTSWRGGVVTHDRRYPEPGENFAQAFEDWPSILSMLCINITEWPIIPLDLGPMLAQNTPNTPKQRWSPGSSVSSSSNTNTNNMNVNVYNTSPAASSTPSTVYVERAPEAKGGGGNFWGSAAGGFVGGLAGAVVGELITGDGNRRSGNGGYRQTGGYTPSRGGYTRPRGNSGGGYTRRGPYQGASPSGRTRTAPPTRDNPGKNGPVFGWNN